MTKSRDFTLFLLKEGVERTEALKLGHKLKNESKVSELPPGATLYILDNDPYTPWWVDYFGISRNLKQAGKGAIVFLTSESREFALCFGHVAHNLNEDSYEYDFGLRTTLNCVDPDKLKNTDTSEPGSARRRRTQLTVSNDLTFFDLDQDSTILRSLTGKVKSEHSETIREATGSTSLRIRTRAQADELKDLCATLLSLYESDDFRTTFANIQNVVPVRDPERISQLNSSLVGAIQDRSTDVMLGIPELVDYSQGIFASFSGAGRSAEYDEVLAANYFHYLNSKDVARDQIDLKTLKKHSVHTTAEDGDRPRTYSIYKSLLLDVELDGDEGILYHLAEGQWYQVDKDYLRNLATFLDKRWIATNLRPCKEKAEEDYNIALAEHKVACLDKTDISPSGQSQIEPCDVISSHEDRAQLIHVKISTDSSSLSHLFNQGVNSVETLKSEDESRAKLVDLVHARSNDGDAAQNLAAAIAGRKFEVLFAIISKKEEVHRSRNLPLFSRISLRRSLHALDLMEVPAPYCFVDDDWDRQNRRKKPRKKPKAKDSNGSASNP